MNSSRFQWFPADYCCLLLLVTKKGKKRSSLFEFQTIWAKNMNYWRFDAKKMNSWRFDRKKMNSRRVWLYSQNYKYSPVSSVCHSVTCLALAINLGLDSTHTVLAAVGYELTSTQISLHRLRTQVHRTSPSNEESPVNSQLNSNESQPQRRE